MKEDFEVEYLFLETKIKIKPKKKATPNKK